VRDESLLKISVFGSVICLVALFILTQSVEETYIDKINVRLVGKNVCVSGEVKSVFKSSKNNYFIKISDKTGEITVVIFNRMISKFRVDEIEKGKTLKVCGKINLYKGYLQIIPYKIMILS
jgi:exonuclease VII large subunit